MSTHKFYSKYKKRKIDRVTDKNIPPLINCILKELDPNDNTSLFLKSLKSFHEQFGGLTSKQFNALKDVEEAFLERSSEEHDQWKRQYDAKKRKIAIVCAEYYKANPPYYASLVDKILNDPKFIPTKKQYATMCENKYTTKVLRETFSKPLFERGALACGRKNAPENIQDKCVTVIAVNDRPVISAAKGAKTYLVLPFGSSDLVPCEERHLKKLKRS